MRIRWTAESRALSDPQVDVSEGDEVDVDDATAKSLIDQGLAEAVTPARQRQTKED